MTTLVCGKCGTTANLRATIDYDSRCIVFCEHCFAEVMGPATDKDFDAFWAGCESVDPEAKP